MQFSCPLVYSQINKSRNLLLKRTNDCMAKKSEEEILSVTAFPFNELYNYNEEDIQLSYEHSEGNDIMDILFICETR